jgi:hypothetical protein
MRQRFPIRAAVLLTVLAVPASVPPAAGETASAQPPQEVAIQGEVLDMACYVSHGAKGEGHAECARRCAKAGQPIGLLAADGKVYLLYASHDDPAAFEQAKSHAGTRVEVRGPVASRDGLHGIEVHSVKPI